MCALSSPLPSHKHTVAHSALQEDAKHFGGRHLATVTALVTPLHPALTNPISHPGLPTRGVGGLVSCLLWHLTLIHVRPSFITNEVPFSCLYNGDMACIFLKIRGAVHRYLAPSRCTANPSSSCFVVIILAELGLGEDHLEVQLSFSDILHVIHLSFFCIDKKIFKN